VRRPIPPVELHERIAHELGTIPAKTEALAGWKRCMAGIAIAVGVGLLFWGYIAYRIYLIMEGPR